MNLSELITNISATIYQEINKGQVNHIVAPKGVVDQILPYHYYQLGDYQISVNKKTLEIDYMYEDRKAISMEFDLIKTNLRVEPKDITEEMVIGSFNDDTKIVNSGIIKENKMTYYLLHHYVKLHMPEMYEKYKLLDKENFNEPDNAR